VAQSKHYFKTICFALESTKLSKRSVLPEEELNENLRDPYDYNFLAKKDVIKPDGLPLPRILYDVNTNKELTEQSSKSTMATTGHIENLPAFHFTME